MWEEIRRTLKSQKYVNWKEICSKLIDYIGELEARLLEVHPKERLNTSKETPQETPQPKKLIETNYERGDGYWEHYHSDDGESYV